jgi:glycosyltransferase involved in cell wall biosynthesis
MRIALNAMQVRAAKSGVGQYIEGLVDGLLGVHGTEPVLPPHDLTVYCSPQNERNYARAGIDHYQTAIWGRQEGNKVLRLLNEIARFGPTINRAGYDLFHGPSNFLPPGLRCPAVVTIHDLSYFVEPERCPYLRRQYWFAMTRLTMGRANRIIADSENTRADIARFFPKAVDKVRVVPLGIHPRFVLPSPSIAPNWDLVPLPLRPSEPSAPIPPYLLSVCTLEPGKNLSFLVRAFEQAAGDFPDVRLVLAGDRGWKYQPLLDQIAASPLRDRILLPGHLSDSAIVTLMQHCRAFVYPSRYEGFGLPPLEALACGAPVLASRGGSLREVLDGLPGVVQHEADDLSGWITTLKEIMSAEQPDEALREEFASSARHRYDWSRTARMTLAVWQEAVATGS